MYIDSLSVCSGSIIPVEILRRCILITFGIVIFPSIHATLTSVQNQRISLPVGFLSDTVVKMQGTAPFTYAIQDGYTFYGVAARWNSNPDVIKTLNPGVDPAALQFGQMINVPSPVNSIQINTNKQHLFVSSGGGGSVRGGYVSYLGPASAVPDPCRWALYEDLWARNCDLMGHRDSPDEIRIIGEAIQAASRESGVDARVILCTIMQESGGNVRVSSTTSWEGVVSTGIMQAHNGASFNSGDADGSICQMVRDGTMGTPSGDGLKQCLDHRGWNYYLKFREYNSGAQSFNIGDLGDGMGATGSYVEKMANRLMGHVWGDM